MAVSNSIGSNIFDILLGLGFPWALRTLVVDHGSSVCKHFISFSFCLRFSWFILHVTELTEVSYSYPTLIMKLTAACFSSADLHK